MIIRVLLFGFCVIFSEVSTQTLDDLISSPNPVVIQEPKPSPSSSTDSKWEELMTALQSIKSTSKIKKERLYKVVKIIKFLLSDEMEKKGEGKKIIEEFKEKIKETESNDMVPEPTLPDFDRAVEERLECIKETIDDRNYMLDKTEVKNKTETVEDEPAPKNKTADFSKIFSKIATALAKLKDQKKESETEIPKLVQIFRPKNGCNKNDFNPTLYENPKQLGNFVSGQTAMNPMSSLSMFNIPCQKASDILEETANFPLPRDMFCENPAANLKSMAKNTKLNLENLPFENPAANLKSMAKNTKLNLENLPFENPAVNLKSMAKNTKLNLENLPFENPAVNLKSMAKNTKLNLENLPFENIVPNSITCIDSDDSIAILFKPKTISLMQVFGNLLKKVTVTVLVPYYVSRLPF